MGTGNSRNFKNTAGARMPGLPIFVGGDYEVKSNRYYIMPVSSTPLTLPTTPYV